MIETVISVSSVCHSDYGSNIYIKHSASLMRDPNKA